MNETKYKTYLEERKSLISTEFDQARSFDKYILTLAAGTFGLSLLFLDRIVTKADAGTIWLLITAWATFGASILSTLISFLLSQEAFSRQLKILDEWYKEEAKDEKSRIENPFAICTKICNFVSMSFFIIGVIFLIIFSSLNLLS